LCEDTFEVAAEKHWGVFKSTPLVNIHKQAAMAAMLREVLGESLFVPDPESDLGKLWKSPEELKRKVLIRASVKLDWAPQLAQLVYIRNAGFRGVALANASRKFSRSWLEGRYSSSGVC
jgi:hypothetical protein